MGHGYPMEITLDLQGSIGKEKGQLGREELGFQVLLNFQIN